MKFWKSEFKFLYRGFKDTLVLIPGWATDYRIYSCLNLNYNYLLPIKFYPIDFTKKLLDELNKISLDKISLFGWSLGGFLASEFALRYPFRINELILSSICKKFNPKDLNDIVVKIKKNKKAYLYKFYLDCFSGKDLEGLTWFKKYLIKNYIDELKLQDLILGLDYLSAIQLEPRTLVEIKKIRIFHGEDDKIVSFKEAIKIKLELAACDLIGLAGIGHISFINHKFEEKFNYE